MYRHSLKENILPFLLWLIPVGILIYIDWWTKDWSRNLPKIWTTNVIPYLINFKYTQNTGMAWGLFQNNTDILTYISIVGVITALIFLFVKSQNKWIAASLSMILAGATGNLIDRVTHKYVIDFIQFAFWKNFPVFNFADMCIVIGTAVLVLYLIFATEPKEKK